LLLLFLLLFLFAELVEPCLPGGIEQLALPPRLATRRVGILS